MSKDGVVPPQGGPVDRPAAGPKDPFAELLGEVLRARMAVLAPGGPPRGGLVRVRRRAQARRRRRAVLTGGASGFVVSAVVALAAGNRFDLVPALTGAAGTGAGAVPGGAGGSAAGRRAVGVAGNSGLVWSGGGAGWTGPAIGPGTPITTLPPALMAAMMPLCSAASLTTTTAVDFTSNGITYGHVSSVVRSACAVVGPPVLTVTNAAGNAAATVRILKEDTTIATALPKIPTWGATLLLQPGQGYQFQFAWAASACAGPAGGPLPSPVASPMPVEYSLGYAVAGTTPAGVVPLGAACGATLFVTDVYAAGQYPLPQPSSSPATTSSSAAASGDAAPSTGSSQVSSPSASATASGSATVGVGASSSASAG